MTFLRLVGAALLAVLVAGVAGCDGPRTADDRYVMLNRPRESPSGSFLALVVPGPMDNGVETRVVVVRDRAGREVFHDSFSYSVRHGIAVTWLSGVDQLWIRSGDVGTSHVEDRGGTWVKTEINPDTIDTIPEEIKELDRTRHR